MGHSLPPFLTASLKAAGSGAITWDGLADLLTSNIDRSTSAYRREQAEHKARNLSVSWCSPFEHNKAWNQVHVHCVSVHGCVCACVQAKLEHTVVTTEQFCAPCFAGTRIADSRRMASLIRICRSLSRHLTPVTPRACLRPLTPLRPITSPPSANSYPHGL